MILKGTRSMKREKMYRMFMYYSIFPLYDIKLAEGNIDKLASELKKYHKAEGVNHSYNFFGKKLSTSLSIET